MNQEIEVRPGIITKDAEGRVKCIPIYSRIVSLFAEQNELQYAVPGGLIGVGLTVSGCGTGGRGPLYRVRAAGGPCGSRAPYRGPRAVHGSWGWGGGVWWLAVVG